MQIPCEELEKIPIYMLSPNVSPTGNKSGDNQWSDTDSDAERHSKSLPVTGSRKSGSQEKSRECESSVKSGPMVRVCRDCKTLVRHLIDSGRTERFH